MRRRVVEPRPVTIPEHLEPGSVLFHRAPDQWRAARREYYERHGLDLLAEGVTPLEWVYQTREALGQRVVRAGRRFRR